MTLTDMSIGYNTNSFYMCIVINLIISCYLILIFQMYLGIIIKMVDNKYLMINTNLKVQAHQN